MATAIEMDRLTRYYGSVRGIEDVTLSVEEGETFGFLGPNGAGKTTTIRLLLDLIRPTHGHAHVLGLDPWRQSQALRRRIGFLPGEPAFHLGLTGRRHLALLEGLRGGGAYARTAEIVTRFDVELDRPIRNLSTGNKRKLAIVQALAHDPDLLLLDEPTAGLDPLMQEEFLHLLAEERQRGVTVFLSSHILSEVERVCDRVAIIREGRLVAVERIADLKGKRPRRMEVTLDRDVAPEDFLAPGVTLLAQEGPKAVLTISGPIQDLFARLAALPLRDVVFPEPTLEDIFLEYYTEEEVGRERHPVP